MKAFKPTAAQCRMQDRSQEVGIKRQFEDKVSPEIIARTFSLKDLTSLK